MTLQTVWHDNGNVKCVDNAGSPAVIHGAEKATADTDVVGEITLQHKVTVEDGVVTSAEYQAPPPPTAEQWYSLIESRADRELQRGVSVTIDGTTYGIRTGAVALSIISGGGLRAERSERRGEAVTRKVPTDKGVVPFDRDGLLAIFEAAEAHQQAIVGRVEELQAMVADGTITSEDLELWP